MTTEAEETLLDGEAGIPSKDEKPRLRGTLVHSIVFDDYSFGKPECECEGDCICKKDVFQYIKTPDISVADVETKMQAGIFEKPVFEDCSYGLDLHKKAVDGEHIEKGKLSGKEALDKIRDIGQALGVNSFLPMFDLFGGCEDTPNKNKQSYSPTVFFDREAKTDSSRMKALVVTPVLGIEELMVSIQDEAKKEGVEILGVKMQGSELIITTSALSQGQAVSILRNAKFDLTEGGLQYVNVTPKTDDSEG